MSTTVSGPDGLGSSGPGPAAGSQTAAAQANAGQAFGNGILQGARNTRDATYQPAEGRAPAVAPQQRHSPPAQPCGNPKGAHASPLAVRRTPVPYTQ
jgi:hypothetical protein